MPVQPGPVLVHLQEILRLFVSQTDPLALMGADLLDFAIFDEPLVVKNVANFQIVIIPQEVVPLINVNA